MPVDFEWAAPLGRDVEYGYLNRSVDAPKQLHPQVVTNDDSTTMLRAIREELRNSEYFSFSVAFVSPRAIALLKQELIDYSGQGTIITSDYLGFNSPAAFAELLNLRSIGIDTRLHGATAYHPKGYIFGYPDRLTGILGSSNLTENALVRNHEWNLKVSATRNSDLARQFMRLTDAQKQDSVPLSAEWINDYARTYIPPARRESASPGVSSQSLGTVLTHPQVTPNEMQRDALRAIAEMRLQGKRKAVVISATGTGKTILSALDVRAYGPRRMLFIVHREQILDRAISEFQRVLGAPASDFGKLTGGHKHGNRRYVFATIQTLSQPEVLATFAADAFDYVLIDEVHRAGARSYGRVLDYLTPDFLLGMTATPERPDSFNVFELFDYNVPYEIRLNRALENDMLAPFHYYGVADVTFEDGITTSIDTDLSLLGSQVRVEHILHAIELYGHAGAEVRGLIFCGRKAEAHLMSERLNGSWVRGQRLRTTALTGDDSIEHRERIVQQLEAGELDYILTVDVFNEGVDIPSVNQVIMLRQTQSSIIFVQQLGRGLRKHPGKEYLVVIDFIGNYANNYLIPIALFGDDSLNKESLRKNLIAAEETGVLAGLSSVRFDRIAQERVLRSIVSTDISSRQRLKAAVEILRNRLGKMPSLHDFLRFESVDPVILATEADNYPTLLEKLFKHTTGLSDRELAALTLLSKEALAAKRPHELLILQTLLSDGAVTHDRLGELFAQAGALATPLHVRSAIRTLTLEFHNEAEQRRYLHPIAVRNADTVSLNESFRDSYSRSSEFAIAVDDIVRTGLELIHDRYNADTPFTPGRQYSRKDACRLLCWDSSGAASTIYGYKVDQATATCPIFVTYHKAADVSSSTAYEDKLLDRQTMEWFSKSKRTLTSPDVAPIAANKVRTYVFSKKEDADGSGHYFLGQAVSSDAEETRMIDGLPVVRMRLRFDAPIDHAVYDYFHPVVMS
ncbi:DUF3427 domain-containing protein [Microbacterium lemovicicum]|nr:DUF3427 domain-containing protein [Microbacterium lemovicicum]